METPAPIQRMIDATNAGDTKAFISTFADDAFLTDWGREFHGRDGILSWNQTDNIGKQAHFEATNTREVSGQYVVTIIVTGGGYNGTGDIVFELAGDRIQKLLIESGH
jgi:hypothetical protein